MEDFEMLIDASNAKDDSRDSNIVSISSEEEVEWVDKKQGKDERTPERKSSFGINLIKQLNSSLSPKLTKIEESNGRVSRYGRHQKSKTLDDGFIPTELSRFLTKSDSRPPKPITFETPNFRIIKTPKKIYPESKTIINNNNESIEKMVVDEKEITVEKMQVDENKIVDAQEENLNVTETLPSDIVNDKSSKPDAIEQGSDIDSGRGSSIDPVFASLISKYNEGEIYWAEYKPRHFWPCLIGPDPDGIGIKCNTGMRFYQIHVNYFADKRSWVVPSKLSPFVPLEKLQETHKVTKACTTKKLFTRSLALANEFVNIPIEQRLERYQADMVEHNLYAVKPKRKSKDPIQEVLNRSLTPDSPVYEDITQDKESVKSDLNKIREMELQKSRKRSLSETSPKVNPKRGRYSQRIELSRAKPKLEQASLSTSLPVGIKKEKKKPVTSPEKTGVELEEYLRKEYMTKDFHYSHIYPDYPIMKEYVCRLCYRPKNLIKCRGCNGQFHDQCVTKMKQGQPIPVLPRVPIGKRKGKKVKSRRSTNRFSITSIKTEATNEDIEIVDRQKIEETTETPIIDLLCFSCEAGTKKCSICQVKGESGEMVDCSQKGCLRHYHKACLVSFPQTTQTVDECTICPYHKCHTCFASTGNESTEVESKLVTCVMCPTAYHYNNIHCIPAGTEWLTTTQIICQNHALRPPATATTNVNWCLICTRGGDLICCESCPGAFHLDCVNEKEIPQGKYTCDNCLSGHRPLYNQVVWAKMGQYRYWPAIILPPMVVPLNIITNFHYPSDFCVKFFGTRDCTWLSRDRVFPFDEDDYQGKNKGSHKGLESAYNKAVAEAKIVYNLIKSEKFESEQKSNHLKPEKYVKIKTNRAVPPIKLELEIDENQEFVCLCKSTDPDPCGYTSQCLNRSSKQECNPTTCPAGTMCRNNAFMKKISPKLQEKHTLNRGWGLFAQEDIPEGSFLVEYVGEVITVEEMNRRMKYKQKMNQANYYFMNLRAGQIIDAGEKGNLARFINHSCMPNAISEQWQVGRTLRVGLFALRNINKEEEITFDYQLECKGDVQKACMCGTIECRGVIGPKKKTNQQELSDSTKTSKKKPKFVLKIKSAKKKKIPLQKIVENDVPQISERIIVDEDLDIKAEYFQPAKDDSAIMQTP